MGVEVSVKLRYRSAFVAREQSPLKYTPPLPILALFHATKKDSGQKGGAIPRFDTGFPTKTGDDLPSPPKLTPMSRFLAIKLPACYVIDMRLCDNRWGHGKAYWCFAEAVNPKPRCSFWQAVRCRLALRRVFRFH